MSRESESVGVRGSEFGRKRMVSRALAQWLVMIFGLALAFSARADKPGPLSAQTLKAPSGPASLKGLGESFSANPGSGTGAHSVPIAVPPGAVTPSIAVKYTGGAGKGEVGVGFTLSPFHVYRQTDKGAPKFDETDRFAVSAADYNDELVLANASLRLYRMKNDDAQVLFQRDTANDRWTVLHPDGHRSFLGETAASRAQAAGKTTRWFIERGRDVHGHEIRYRYTKNQGKVYWSGVDYQLEAAAAYRNRVELAYEVRPDPIRDYRYGDLELTASRLAKIEVYQGTRLLRRYTFGYVPDALWSLLGTVTLEGEFGERLPTLRFEYLSPSKRSGRFVTMEGIASLSGFDTGRVTLEDVNADGLPDLLTGNVSSYSYAENVDGVRFASTTVLATSGSPDRSLDAAGVVLTDVDGDGYRDVFYPIGDGRFRFFPGGRIDRGRFLGFGAAQVLNGNNVVTDVTRPEIRLTDLNSDGRTDLLYQRTGIGDVWVENHAVSGFVQRSMPTLPAGVVLSNGAFELLDFNGDSTLDLVQREFDVSKHNLKIWYGLGGGKYSAEQIWMAPIASPKEVFLTDVNRDGQTDLVRVSGSWVSYYLNDGRGAFALRHGDFRGMPETARTKKVLLADMNGNGTSDVVWFAVDGALSYLDLMGEPNVGLLARIDNGMGLVTDIGYASSTDYAIEAKLRGSPWRTPLPHPVPVIAEVSVRDSLDLLGVEAPESRITYDYREGYYDGKEREFRGFAQVFVTEWGDDLHDSAVNELRMHVGRALDTGSDEEVLKGKVWLQAVRNPEGAVFSSTETKWEARWTCQEDLGAGASAVLPSCTGISDRNARKDDLVRVVLQTGALQGFWERQATARYSANKKEYDVWGNPTRVEEYGEVTLPGGHTLGQAWTFTELNVAVGEDERAQETDYANRADPSAGTWLIGYPVEHRVETLSGVVASQGRTYYDGDAFTGLPLGQVTRGLVSRTEEWYGEQNRWVPVARNAYNTDGLVTQSLDATGRSVRIAYDPETRVLPTTERVALDEGGEAVFQATYDRGHGVIATLTDPNLQTNRYLYDGLGRIEAIIDPKGSALEPLVTYDYSYGTPDEPISVTTVRQLVTRGAGVYRTSLHYSDAAGRPRLVKVQAESGYVGSGFETLSARGAVTRSYEAFSSSTSDFEPAPAGTPFTALRTDAQGRPVDEYLPETPEQGASFRRTEYLPFATRAYDEKDATEGTLAYPTTTRFDGLGRVRQVEKKNQGPTQIVTLTWTLGYDVRDNLRSFKDPRNFERTYGYDQLGRLSTLSDPNLGAVTYGYDDAGRLTKRADALGQEQINEYDGTGRLKRHTNKKLDDQGMLRVEAEYVYRYDRAGTGNPLTNPTNLVGHLTAVEFPIGAEYYSYDERGLVEREAVSLWNGRSPFAAQERTTHLRSAKYNAEGDETRRELPDDFSVTTAYNARGLIERISGGLPSSSRDIVSQTLYDASEEPVDMRQGNGLRSCRRYDARGQITGTLLGKSSDVTCAPEQFDRASFGSLHTKYRWVRDGMLDTITDLSVARAGAQRLDAAYQYDRLHQLTSATTAQARFGYEYDSIQNVTRRTRQVGSQSPTAEDLVYGESAGPNALTHAGATRLDYDAIGQLERHNGYDLKFDVEGQLVEANKPGGKRVEYFYDAWGDRRVLVVTEPGGRKRVFRYPFDEYQERDGEAIYSTEGMGVSAELRKSPGLEVDAALLDELTTYVNAPQGKPKPLPAEWMDLDSDGDGFDAQDLAEAQRAFWESRRAGGARVEWRYAQRDHLGSSVLVTDSVGDPVSVRRHEPYGVLAQRSGVQPIRGFTGAEVEPDEEVGLVRMGARYYAPGLGRWITPDRAIGESPQAMLDRLVESNLYSYGGNNPIVAVDPNGEFIFLVAVAVVVGITITAQYANAPAPGEKTYHKSDGELAKEMVENSAAVYSALRNPGGFVRSLARQEAKEEAKALADKVDSSGTLSTVIDVADSVASSGGKKGGPQQLGVKKMASKKPAPKPKAKPPVIEVSRKKHPESAKHIEEAQAAGHPSVVTIDRGGAKKRRSQSLKGVKTKKGKDRDEYPPAMFKEGGKGASVKHIKSSDNQGAGACIGGQCRPYSDGTQVQIKVVEW